MEIFDALSREPGITKVALERPLGTNRPDVSAYINGVPVAIEVQLSALSLDTLFQRTREYALKGVYVLWLPQWTPDLDAARYSPQIWERWIHAAFFGRIYYWIEGLSVVSYHFDPHYKTVPASSWYSAGGKKMTARAYSRKSKRHCSPVRGETLNLATDFTAKEREWWTGGGFTIPTAKLFMER